MDSLSLSILSLLHYIREIDICLGEHGDDVVYKFFKDVNDSDMVESIQYLKKNNLVDTSGITERGKAFIEHIHGLTLPVQKWVIETDQDEQ